MLKKGGMLRGLMGGRERNRDGGRRKKNGGSRGGGFYSLGGIKLSKGGGRVGKKKHANAEKPARG